MGNNLFFHKIDLLQKYGILVRKSPVLLLGALFCQGLSDAHDLSPKGSKNDQLVEVSLCPNLCEFTACAVVGLVF
jgi:hypothetical protein